MATSSKHSKLTLRLERRIIERAKRYAHERGTSLSQMVANYFDALTRADAESPEAAANMEEDLGPVTRALAGLLRGSGLDESDYHKHLEEKHLGVRHENNST